MLGGGEEVGELLERHPSEKPTATVAKRLSLGAAGRRYCAACNEVATASIGAGAAGLGALKVLLDEGFSVDCFERSDRVGGHWHTDYECLHLITPRGSSGFEGAPMPDDYPLFPSRDQMRDYIVGFAEQHELARAHRLRHRGHGAAAGRRRLGARDRRRRASPLRRRDRRQRPSLGPVRPGVPRHASTGASCTRPHYRNAGDLAGDRVLVVGAGNSGCDLAVDAAQAGSDTYVSVRHGLVFQPKTLFGRPRSELPLLGRLPVALQERVSRALIDVSLGAPERYGLPAPATRNLHRNRPVVNGQLLHFIHHGRVHVVPGIERFDGHTVHFTDGTARDVRHDRVRHRLQGHAAVPGSRRCCSGATASRCAWPA